MLIHELMEAKNITKYRLAKDSGIAYTTINDICSGKAQLEKCSAETIYRVSKALGVSMESLIEPCLEKRSDFENVYALVKSEEIESKDILIEFEKDYPKVAKESNINEILKSLKEKRKEDDRK